MEDKIDEILQLLVTETIDVTSLNVKHPKWGKDNAPKEIVRQRDKAKQQISELIREARIDELSAFREDDNGGYYLTRNGNNVQERLNQLKEEQLGEK